MTIPTTFPAHWRAAIERGDASGFTNREDMIAFFTATDVHETFMKFTGDEKDHVVEMRSQYHDESLDARLRLHAKDREAAKAVIARNRANFGTGNAPAAIPPAAKAPEKPKANPWTKVVEHFNADFAADIYAKRAKARGV
ncbi:hypothetical protein LB553_07205 [Mesorhizobium sp. CA8]|uniref:hypothetical protein n=1 Tax=Mesorhizobium sp. CA8 TaxID=2876637 RepID=UPI001CCD80B9|nr:hypothetical protein [Mesorhizobium sp. CA8]MBZ9760665.1 hypothetical protein [Mesorhizobium sp. CA8]